MTELKLTNGETLFIHGTSEHISSEDEKGITITYVDHQRHATKSVFYPMHMIESLTKNFSS